MCEFLLSVIICMLIPMLYLIYCLVEMVMETIISELRLICVFWFLAMKCIWGSITNLIVSENYSFVSYVYCSFRQFPLGALQVNVCKVTKLYKASKIIETRPS